jgi:P27 family predicted phage terminase small subunit
MGQRGPKPQPNIVALAKGDPGKRAKRHQGTEPKPPSLDEVPAYLPARARKEWLRLRKMAADMGAVGDSLFTQADRRPLETYCLACDAQEWAAKDIQKNGYTFETMNREGNPAVQILNDAGKVIKSMSALFGFSPADRARMQLPEPEADVDEIEEALNG